MPTAGSKQPSSFADGVNAAMQDLAAAMSAPDADLHFGTEMIKVMGTFLQAQHKPVSQPPGGAAAGGGKPPGMSLPGGPAGGGAANPAEPNVTAPPSGPPPEPGSGPTPGLTMSGPGGGGGNPDEMRRVLQEVAGQ